MGIPLLLFRKPDKKRSLSQNPYAYKNEIVALFGANLICYLPMWEGSGAIAEDQGPEGNDAALSATGVTLGQTGIGDGHTSFLFDGTAGFLNLAASGLGADFDGAAGTIACWVKLASADVWADGVGRYVCLFRYDASNAIFMNKSTVSGRFDFTYVAGGTQKQVALSSQSWTDWKHVALTWDKAADQFLAFVDGAQVGTTGTSLGTWSGALAATRQVIGAAVTTPTLLWSGWLAHFVMLDRAATPTEVAEMATLPFEVATSTPNPSAAQTVTVANGGDIAAAIATMRQGDILSLAAGGSYTLAGDASGFSTLPSGVSTGHTTVLGNGATVTGGTVGLYLATKSYIDVQDLNIAESTSLLCHLTGCHHITLTDCDFVSASQSVFYDCVRLTDCDDCTIARCIASAPGRDSSDGFEVWGPCNRITFTDCTAHTMNNSGASDRHGFEVYAADAAGVCNTVTYDGCEAYGCNVGFSCEGGTESAAHVDVICNSCSSHDNAQYGYQGIQGATLYRQGTPGDNTDNGTAETFGTVTDL